MLAVYNRAINCDSLSCSYGQTFVVALNKIRILARPRENLQFGIDGEEDRLSGSVKWLADADFARRDRTEDLLQ